MIAIPNMEKPKGCWDCFNYDCDHWGEHGYDFAETDCPLIEIVRCRECTHHDEDGWGYGECKRPSVDYLRTADEDFCSYGERRADDSNT